jgi:alpha-methylacyl-CoA racemase
MAAIIGRGEDGPGTHLDVSIADGVLWMTSLAVDEHLATGERVGPGHNIITGRYACYDSYRAADGGWLAVGAIEAKFFANLCRLLGCPQWIDHQLDDDAQDAIRAEFREVFATRGRDAWVAELAGSDTCVTPVLTVEELVDDEQFTARGAIVEAVTAPADGTEATGFRQVGPVLAGMAPVVRPVVAGDPSRSDTDRLLRGAGLTEVQITELRDKGVVA